MTHDFEGVLKRMTEARSWKDGCAIQQVEAVLVALRIAGRLQKGEVSDGMYDVGDEMCMSFADRNEFTDDEEVFKAMSQQLFKECEDE